MSVEVLAEGARVQALLPPNDRWPVRSYRGTERAVLAEGEFPPYVVVQTDGSVLRWKRDDEAFGPSDEPWRVLHRDDDVLVQVFDGTGWAIRNDHIPGGLESEFPHNALSVPREWFRRIAEAMLEYADKNDLP